MNLEVSMQSNRALQKIDTHQQGMVLVIGLIMMLLLSIIGMAAIRGSGMQELMAGNIKDRNLAFQAAEASLREAESLVDLNVANCNGFVGTNGCYADQNSATPVIAWSDAQWGNGSAEAVVDLTLGKKPRYVIEKLSAVAVAATTSGSCLELGCDTAEDTNMTYYRITSIGYGGSENAQVMLQSTYRHGS
jgi:type IV pilus assembly protein PilX